MPLNSQDNSEMLPFEISSVQTELSKDGYDPGPVDGIMGLHTESAIIAFKRAHGLKPRSWVGPKTWRLLHEPEFKKITVSPNDLPWMIEAKKALGRHEVQDNLWLRKWLASDSHALGDPAKFPWCGDFVETPIRLTLFDEPIPVNPYWALNWRKFGVPSRPTYGCVASIKRTGGGHVMFLVGQDSSRYYALGGNQSNKSSVVPVDKSRFVPQSFRWPSTYPQRPLHLPHMSSSDLSNTREG